MSLKADLLALESKFWSGDAAYYREHLDDKCLTAFTDMAGVSSRKDIAAMVKKGDPHWRNLIIELKGLLEPAPGVAILTYEASADRAEDEHYEAIASSLYVLRDGAWKLAFHQQTPLVAPGD
jgi:hypothetical protein